MMGGGSHVVLIGLRGSGKSSVGRLVSSALHRPFIDLDELTLQVLGVESVQQAWDDLGEPRFREAECVALGRALEVESPSIIALGGGTPTAPGADERLARASAGDRAIVIYLDAPIAVLASRVAAARSDGDDSRPSLTGVEPVAEIEEVHRQRDSRYRALAHEIIDASASPAKVCDAVIRVVEKR